MEHMTIVLATSEESHASRWLQAIKLTGWHDLRVVRVSTIPALRDIVKDLVMRRIPFMVVTLPYLEGRLQPEFVLRSGLETLFGCADPYCQPRPIIVVNEFNEVCESVERANTEILHNLTQYQRLTERINYYLNEVLFLDYVGQTPNQPTLAEARQVYQNLLLVIQSQGHLTRHMEAYPLLQASLHRRWEILARFASEYAQQLLGGTRRYEDAPALAENAPSSSSDYKRLLQYCLLALSFLRESLVIRTWEQRASSNAQIFEAAQGIPVNFRNLGSLRQNSCEKAMRDTIARYHRQNRTFVETIRTILTNVREGASPSPKLPKRDAQSIEAFRSPGNVTLFQELSDQFGPRNIVTNDEPGWSLQAVAIDHLFRYEIRKAQRQELAAEWKTMDAAFLWLLDVLAGYGFRPRKLVLWLSLVIAFFTLAYSLNDSLSGCDSVAGPTHLLAFLGHHLFIALASLTGLGANPSTCGPYSGILLGAETLCGYFLLSIIAAVVIEILQNR